MNKRIMLTSIAATLVLATVLAATYWPAGPPAPAALTTADRKPMSIAVVTGINDPLVIIALEKGYFRDEGLDVAVKRYSTGPEALARMLDGDVDMASCSETPIVFNSFLRKDFRIVTTTAAWDDYLQIVAVRSRGIASPGNLRGKRIATQKGAAVEFYLHTVLAKYGLTPRDAQVSYMPQQEMPAALAAGQIDAIATREPYVTQAQAKLGNDAVVFAEPGLYTMTVNLTTLQKLIDARPGTVRGVLRALLKAEAFATQHPDETVEILARTAGVAKDTMAKLLRSARMAVRIDQALLLTLEEEARWAIGVKLTDKPDIPNYLGLIHVDALKSLKPSAVTLIH